MEASDPTNMAADRPFTTKTEWVYQQLRARILGGKDKLDPRLRLSTLAQEFRISEMPVREALRMLQRDGLVSMESHRGATIVDLELGACRSDRFHAHASGDPRRARSRRPPFTGSSPGH